jgi:hypothetical protein
LDGTDRKYLILNISQAEATEFSNILSDKWTYDRKVKTYVEHDDDDDDDEVNNIEYYHNVIDLTECGSNISDITTELAELVQCNIPKTRGSRLVFVSNTTIGIGTTVVFNKNWATINFEDRSIMKTLRELQNKYKAKA